MVLLSALVRFVGLGGRASGAVPSDGGAEADAPRAATASSDGSYGVNGNPVMASSSPSLPHEACGQSSTAGASFGRRDPAPASSSSSFSQYEDSEQASCDDEEMATLILPPRPRSVPNPYATISLKQRQQFRAGRRLAPEQRRRMEANRLAALRRRQTRRRTLVTQRRLANGSDPAQASSSSSFSQYEGSARASRDDEEMATLILPPRLATPSPKLPPPILAAHPTTPEQRSRAEANRLAALYRQEVKRYSPDTINHNKGVIRQ